MPATKKSRKSSRSTKVATRPSDNKLYKYVQMVSGGRIASIFNQRRLVQASTATVDYFEFFLSQLPQYGTYTALYDQYRIDKIKVELYPNLHYAATAPSMTSTTQVITNTAVTAGGVIATMIDYDGGVTASTLDAAMEYQSCRVQPAINTKKITRTFVPRTLGQMQEYGGANVSASSKAGVWLDCAYVDVVHYGLKVYLDAYADSYNKASYEVVVTFYVSFRNVR